ncbi:MAG: CpsD/CapB family tyrosine-protein kinase [Burkholderiaceae bacterium]
MERIKLAIEKAKAGANNVPRLEPVFVPPPVEGLPAGVRGEIAMPAVRDVNAPRTEIVDLNDIHLERHRIIAHQKAHPVSWAFDLLRTQILQKMDEHGWRTVAITSPTVESGKTLVSINLAISIAQQTHRTALLVDFDLRRPRVAASLGLRREVSLNEVLAGEAELSQALVNPGMERLVILPTLRPEPKAAEVLASRRVNNLVTELRNRYADRTVIIDLPPVLVADDVLALLPHVDCVLLVVASGGSTEKEIEESMVRLKGANLVGVVLNKDDSPAQSGYGYY